MRSIPIALLIVTWAVGAGTSGRWVASASDTARTLRVATFNIHKGADRPGRYDLERTIDAIHRLDADLVGLQEAMRNDPAFGCDDQPALIAEGLRRRTGRPWTHAYVNAWVTENRQCLTRGGGDDVATEGLAILTRDRILSSTFVRLSEGRRGLAVWLASLPDVPVVVTHLSANRANQADRVRELGVLLPWAARQGPGILIGDFNAQPDSSELAPVLARYRDGWAEAAAGDRAGGVASGSTRPFGRVSRIDYVLYAPGAALTLESVDVIDTATLGLGQVSDHHPVVATFRRGTLAQR